MRSLRQLIESCDTMNEHEKELWTALVPHLSPDHGSRLRAILQREADDLAALEAKHSPEAVSLARKNLDAMERHANEGRDALVHIDLALVENRRFRLENGLAIS